MNARLLARRSPPTRGGRTGEAPAPRSRSQGPAGQAVQIREHYPIRKTLDRARQSKIQQTFVSEQKVTTFH